MAAIGGYAACPEGILMQSLLAKTLALVQEASADVFIGCEHARVSRSSCLLGGQTSDTSGKLDRL